MRGLARAAALGALARAAGAPAHAPPDIAASYLALRNQTGDDIWKWSNEEMFQYVCRLSCDPEVLNIVPKYRLEGSDFLDLDQDGMSDTRSDLKPLGMSKPSFKGFMHLQKETLKFLQADLQDAANGGEEDDSASGDAARDGIIHRSQDMELWHTLSYLDSTATAIIAIVSLFSPRLALAYGLWLYPGAFKLTGTSASASVALAAVAPHTYALRLLVPLLEYDTTTVALALAFHVLGQIHDCLYVVSLIAGLLKGRPKERSPASAAGAAAVVVDSLKQTGGIAVLMLATRALAAAELLPKAAAETAWQGAALAQSACVAVAALVGVCTLVVRLLPANGTEEAAGAAGGAAPAASLAAIAYPALKSPLTLAGAAAGVALSAQALAGTQAAALALLSNFGLVTQAADCIVMHTARLLTAAGAVGLYVVGGVVAVALLAHRSGSGGPNKALGIPSSLPVLCLEAGSVVLALGWALVPSFSRPERSMALVALLPLGAVSLALWSSHPLLLVAAALVFLRGYDAVSGVVVAHLAALGAHLLRLLRVDDTLALAAAHAKGLLSALLSSGTVGVAAVHAAAGAAAPPTPAARNADLLLPPLGPQWLHTLFPGGAALSKLISDALPAALTAAAPSPASAQQHNHHHHSQQSMSAFLSGCACPDAAATVLASYDLRGFVPGTDEDDFLVPPEYQTRPLPVSLFFVSVAIVLLCLGNGYLRQRQLSASGAGLVVLLVGWETFLRTRGPLMDERLVRGYTGMVGLGVALLLLWDATALLLGLLWGKSPRVHVVCEVPTPASVAAAHRSHAAAAAPTAAAASQAPNGSYACPNLRCGLPVEVAAAPLPGSVMLEGVRCGSCGTVSCPSCHGRWHPRNASASHLGFNCADYARFCAADPAPVPRSRAVGHKLCPVCAAAVSVYRGHGRHHVMCPACSVHFCFVCLRAYANQAGLSFVCASGCSDVCSSMCDCLPCPTCRPGAPCPDCAFGTAHGSPLTATLQRIAAETKGKWGSTKLAAWADSCCPVCAGIAPPSPAGGGSEAAGAAALPALARFPLTRGSAGQQSRGPARQFADTLYVLEEVKPAQLPLSARAGGLFPRLAHLAAGWLAAGAAVVLATPFLRAPQ